MLSQETMNPIFSKPGCERNAPKMDEVCRNGLKNFSCFFKKKYRYQPVYQALEIRHQGLTISTFQDHHC
ncbi:hypothetical protein L0128_14115, partial [candidate division KSB1 bacterium]|nr:hypothetical protein [candidate division KSB1 bacterium]